MTISIDTPETVQVQLGKKAGSVTHSVRVADLPQLSLNHIFAYGLRQILNDAMASAESESEAQGMVQKRLDNLLAGTLRASPVREGDPVRKRALELATQAVIASEAFIKACQKAGVRTTHKDAVAKAKAKAAEVIAVEGNRFTAQAEIDVASAKAIGTVDLGDFSL